ncbi:hypothetical protein J27TS7_57760 [Paenibacillus dendritiformis]|uniref:hypothetical protein n=1 Tax=Paenibacillus dendritiformis TaxID=130049 RepID=UPI001B059C28|nr:hypothetical protein [Paenibacillus dendritiformis]GIO76262.1 hypothetical protein J27TS7_57760 [Paenibacillus dendritiformis]
MNELEEIWESWDYHLEEALIRADQIVRLMFKEAKMFRVPQEQQDRFFREKMRELMKRVAAKGGQEA